MCYQPKKYFYILEVMNSPQGILAGILSLNILDTDIHQNLEYWINIKVDFNLQLQSDWAQVQVIQLRNDGAGFGFGISGSRNSGAVVRNIFPGGAADRVSLPVHGVVLTDLVPLQEGHLKNGDHLLQVGDVRLWGMGAQQVGSSQM